MWCNSRMELPAWATDLWDRASASAPPPDLRTTVIIAGVMLVVAFSRSTWPLARHGITVAHEGAHALVATLFGRRLQGIRLHADTSGLTVSRGKPTGFGMIATAFAGYVGPAVLGLGAAWIITAGHGIGLLWGLLAALVIMLVWIRNWFGLSVVLIGGGALFAVVWWAPAPVQVIVATAIAWFLLIGALRPVVEMQQQRSEHKRRGRRLTSDADALGRLTWFPAGVWVAVFGLVVLGCAALGGWWLLREGLAVAG